MRLGPGAAVAGGIVAIMARGVASWSRRGAGCHAHVFVGMRGAVGMASGKGRGGVGEGEGELEGGSWDRLVDGTGPGAHAHEGVGMAPDSAWWDSPFQGLATR